MAKKSITFDCIEIHQPIGTFYIGAIPASDLCQITKYDFRRLEGENDGFDNYLGIQRKVSDTRKREIGKYVLTKDACFPSAVIIAVEDICSEYDSSKSKLTLFEYIDEEDSGKNIPFSEIAIVLDGQHRIAGLIEGGIPDEFQINVSLFVGIDIADQAYIFSTVNLAQSKVNKSLVFDLFDLAKKRSPQKTCHNIAIALDREETSPLFQKIKRLGTTTVGRYNETIAQATFVQSLLRYISKDPIIDRDLYMRNKIPNEIDADALQKLIFRNMFIQNKDLEITDIIWNYFNSIKKRWPAAWDSKSRGQMLNKTNGFKALMRFLRDAYLYLNGPGEVPTTDDFLNIFNRINLNDADFDIEKYKPGTSGESSLYNDLKILSNI